MLELVDEQLVYSCNFLRVYWNTITDTSIPTSLFKIVPGSVRLIKAMRGLVKHTEPVVQLCDYRNRPIRKKISAEGSLKIMLICSLRDNTGIIITSREKTWQLMAIKHPLRRIKTARATLCAFDTCKYPAATATKHNNTINVLIWAVVFKSPNVHFLVFLWSCNSNQQRIDASMYYCNN